MEKCNTHIVVDEPDRDEYRDFFARYAPDLRVTICEDPASPPTEVMDAEILLTWEPHPHVLKAMPNLKWIHSTGAGVDGILKVAHCFSPHVLLTRTGGMTGATVAQYVVTFILVTHYNIPSMLTNQKQHQWCYFKVPLVAGLRCTILGMGEVGQEIARRCIELGLHVVGVSRSGNLIPAIETVISVSELNRVLPETDILVIAVPLTSETQSLIDKGHLNLLPPSSVLINVSRGSVVVEQDLIDVLQQGKLKAAVLDVFNCEPLPLNSPLWDTQNVIITPHLAGTFTAEFSATAFLKNLERYRLSESMNHTVDYTRGY